MAAPGSGGGAGGAARAAASAPGRGGGILARAYASHLLAALAEPDPPEHFVALSTDGLTGTLPSYDDAADAIRFTGLPAAGVVADEDVVRWRSAPAWATPYDDLRAWFDEMRAGPPPPSAVHVPNAAALNPLRAVDVEERQWPAWSATVAGLPVDICPTGGCGRTDVVHFGYPPAVDLDLLPGYVVELFIDLGRGSGAGSLSESWRAEVYGAGPRNAAPTLDQRPHDHHADRCWRCDARPAVSDLGCCGDCLDFLRSPTSPE